MRTLRRTCATIATLRRPSSVDAAMRSGWLVRSCLAAPSRSGPLAISALAAPNMTMQAAVLRIGLSLAFLQETSCELLCCCPLQAFRASRSLNASCGAICWALQAMTKRCCHTAPTCDHTDAGARTLTHVYIGVQIGQMTRDGENGKKNQRGSRPTETSKIGV